jgi:hypothetical protein
VSSSFIRGAIVVSMFTVQSGRLVKGREGPKSVHYAGMFLQLRFIEHYLRFHLHGTFGNPALNHTLCSLY